MNGRCDKSRKTIIFLENEAFKKALFMVEWKDFLEKMKKFFKFVVGITVFLLMAASISYLYPDLLGLIFEKLRPLSPIIMEIMIF